MSKHLTELCSLLVRETYGELPSRIIYTLFEHGRLSLSQLCQLSHLPSRSVKHGLALLVQQSLLYHFTTHVDGRPQDDQTFYEVNVRNIYDTVRHGKMTAYIEERFGENAAQLITLLQNNGYASAEEVLDWVHGVQMEMAYRNTHQHVNGNELATPTTKVNGINGVHVTSSNEKRKEACTALFDTNLVVEVTDSDFMPPADFHAMVENNVKVVDYKGEVKGTKQLLAFRADVLKRKREMLDNNTASIRRLENTPRRAQQATTGNSQISRKRPDTNGDYIAFDQSDGANDRRPNKKRKVDEDEEMCEVIDELSTGNGPSDVMELSPLGVPLKADPAIPSYRLNYNKFDVSFRNRRLLDLAARALGEPAAEVYSVLLRRLEHSIPRCHDEFAQPPLEPKPDEEGEDVGDGSLDGPSVTSDEIQQDLNSSVDLSLPSDNDKHANVKIETAQESGPDSYSRTVSSEVKRSTDRDSLDVKREKRIAAIEQHLRLLSEHFLHFCTRSNARGLRSWTVDFRQLTRSLLQFELEAVIKARFGDVAARIIRILHSKGKLDEKQLGSIGLIRQKDLRRVLALMQESGYVDTQEVPKDSTRQPSRTIYLWFYDQDRCRKLVLNDIYKSMSRLIQRAKVEQKTIQSVLDKAERTDVKGHEEEFLLPAERTALALWQYTEQKLLVELARQDDLVALFRDYAPMG